MASTEPRMNALQQVLATDASFSSHRPHLRAQDDEETLYVKWRTLLLYRQMKANRIVVDAEGDRRADYLFDREYILSNRFPSRNRSRRPQEGYFSTYAFFDSPSKSRISSFFFYGRLTALSRSSNELTPTAPYFIPIQKLLSLQHKDWLATGTTKTPSFLICRNKSTFSAPMA